MNAEVKQPTTIRIDDPKKWVVNISIGTILAIVSALWGGLAISRSWHFETFITVAQAKEQERSVKDEVTAATAIARQNAIMLSNHIGEFRVTMAVIFADRAADRLNHYKRENDPDDPGYQAQLDLLKRSKDKADNYLNCLVAGNGENCEALKPTP